jgi:hypothetical protein
MGRDTNLSNSLDDQVSIVDSVVDVGGILPEGLERLWLSIVVSYQSFKDQRVLQIYGEVRDLLWMHWVDLVVVV